LTDRFQALQDVAGPVSRETFRSLQSFETMFREWASRINLVASSTLEEIWSRHILDSAQLWPLFPSHSTKILDLGSGGGFPGLVLGFLLKDRDGGRIDLVDSNRKKTAFLQACAGQFALPAKIHSVRIGDEIRGLQQPDIVTARALAPLPELLSLAFPWLSLGASGFFHKGRDYRSELSESSDMWRFDLVEHPSKIDADSVILEINGLESRR
jgi:16S rRNA (guanine527-N7)-methyltransferase